MIIISIDKIAEHAKEDVSLVKKLELYENEIEKDEYINTIFEDNIDKYVPPSAPTITVPMPNLSVKILQCVGMAVSNKDQY